MGDRKRARLSQEGTEDAPRGAEAVADKLEGLIRRCAPPRPVAAPPAVSRAWG